MGFSNPISAIIILGVFISVLFTMPGVLESITSIEEISSEVKILENSITNTNFNINNLYSEGGAIIVNFTITNTGTEKIWDYENFDIVITYDADLGGTKSKETESMVYDPNPTLCNGLKVNEWTIYQITNNLLEPTILNKDEAAQVCLRLDNPVFPGGNVIVTVSTDLGKTVSSAVSVT